MGKERSQVASWKFPVLFKSRRHMVSPRFHLFVFEFDQQWNEGAGQVQDYLT